MGKGQFRKALVTGGAGFIGSHIVRRLVGMGMQVNVLDDLSVGKRDNLPSSESVRFFMASVSGGPLPAGALEGVDVVFHNAARVSIRNSFDDAMRDADTNVLGTVNILKASAGAGIRRFIYASSMAVYDTDAQVPLAEDSPLSPSSPYGVSKLAGEMYTRLIARASGFDHMILMYFNTYGAGQTLSPYVGVITIFTERLLKGEPPVIFGDGEQRRDFIHVGDVAEANIRAMTSDEKDLTINVGTGRGRSVNEVAEMLTKRIAPSIAPVHGPEAAGEPRDSIADITLARRALGLDPSTDMETLIHEVIESRKALLSVAG